MARYSQEFRARLVEQIAKQKPSYAELLQILEKRGVPRTTFQYWWQKWKSLGDPDGNQRGRPPAGFRQIVRQEIERGLNTWFGDPPIQKKSRS